MQPIQGGITVFCPAKLNLFLEVTGRRPDGYHDLETVMETISIYDEIEIRPGGSGVRVTCDDAAVACDATNTAWRAAELTGERAGRREGVEIAITKRIPAGGGLGGGSSDAAGVLLGLDRLWGLGWSQQALIGLAAQIGSDVPFFMVRGTALCRGRGEIVQKLEGCGHRWYVVLFPNVSVSTAAVYKNLGSPLTGPCRSAKMLVELLQSGESAAACRELFNRLEQSAVRLHPRLGSCREAMESIGLRGVGMSGSGSCYYGVCVDAEEAERKRRQLGSLVEGRVFAAETAE
jgi:4-diphosphocytidyl-2-C-methyl-D-erythritol kinase